MNIRPLVPDAELRIEGAAPIVLLPPTPGVSADALQATWSGEIVACDWYVAGAEHGELVSGGYALGRVLNVDHHAPTTAMARQVSSTNLAIERIRSVGGLSLRTTVVVTHIDCDSVLSAGIMAGALAPHDHYGHAAIAADHTGMADDVADLLQALDSQRDLALSLASLRALESSEPLPAVAVDALTRRRTQRTEAVQRVREGVFRRLGALAIGVFEEPPDTEFFPALLPDAAVILIAAPHPARAGRWIAKLRLGKAAPTGLTLHQLNVSAFDASYGGRWNAGANRRAGGTELTPEAYAALLGEQLEAVLG